jgi:hypothetical protein
MQVITREQNSREHTKEERAHRAEQREQEADKREEISTHFNFKFMILSLGRAVILSFSQRSQSFPRT